MQFDMLLNKRNQTLPNLEIKFSINYIRWKEKPRSVVAYVEDYAIILDEFEI